MTDRVIDFVIDIIVALELYALGFYFGKQYRMIKINTINLPTPPLTS